jgi:hypothetical protein
MKRISEITKTLYQNQLLNACKIVLDKQAKISSLIIESNTFEIIRHLISTNLIVKDYEIDDKYSLIIIAKYQESIEIIEEINELSISKFLKETIYTDLFGTF